jgi:hypothetical protein
MEKDDLSVAMLDLEHAHKLLHEAGRILLHAMDTGLPPEKTVTCRNLVDRAEAKLGSLAGYLSMSFSEPTPL